MVYWSDFQLNIWKNIINYLFGVYSCMYHVLHEY